MRSIIRNLSYTSYRLTVPLALVLPILLAGCNKVQPVAGKGGTGTGGSDNPSANGTGEGIRHGAQSGTNGGNNSANSSTLLTGADAQNEDSQNPKVDEPIHMPDGGFKSNFTGNALPNTDVGIGAPELDTEPTSDIPIARDGTDLSERPFMTLQGLDSTDPKQLMSHLKDIDSALTELVSLSSDNQIEKTLFLESGKRLGKLKLAAGQQLANLPQANESQRTAGVKSQLIALSHLSSLHDVAAARQLEELATATANAADPDLAHHSRLVLVGFELQELQNGVETEPKELLLQIGSLFENFKGRSFPEFMMLQQADVQLTKLGFRDEAARVRGILVEQYKDAEDAALRNEAWLYVTSESAELADYNYANQLLGTGQITSSDQILAPTQALFEAFPTVQTLEQLSKSIANMEYLGFIETSQQVSKYVRSQLELQPQSASRTVAEKLLSDHEKRLSLIGKPFPFQAFENNLIDFNGNPFSKPAAPPKATLVFLWATWSIPSIEELRPIVQMYEKYQSDGLEVIGIIMDDKPRQSSDFILSQNLPWKNFFFKEVSGFKSQFAIDNGINIIPFVVIVDSRSNTTTVHARGANLEPEIRAALGLENSLLEDVKIP